MAKFDVSDAVDELTYDFTKFVPDAKGTIPEPTDDDLMDFRRTMADLLPVKDGKLDYSALSSRLEETNDPEGRALTNSLYDAVGKLCHNSPSGEQIRALPYRGQKAFVGWIMGLFLNPEA